MPRPGASGTGIVPSGLMAGMGLLPERMVDRYVAEGSVRRLCVTPPVEDGRLLVGTRQGYEEVRGAAVIRTISGVLERMGYLRTPR